MEKGYIQVYTGDGKGKTTAALGLALRALCAGRRVLILQFLKGQPTGELAAVEKFERLRIERFGAEHFVKNPPADEDIALAAEGLRCFSAEIASGEWDIVIADELNVAVQMGLVAVSDALSALKGRAPGTEVVITGRGAPVEFLELADLVTEMREVKHYWRAGVAERVGIER